MDGVLARWNGLPPGQAPAALGERLEELFLEASMLEAVRGCWRSPCFEYHNSGDLKCPPVVHALITELPQAHAQASFSSVAPTVG